MATKTISMLELRLNAKGFIDGLKAGRGFVLSYRGENVAKIEPIKKETDLEQDPFFSFAQIARPSPLGKLDPEEIDSIIYEE